MARRRLVSRTNREEFTSRGVSPARRAALGMLVSSLSPKAPGMDQFLDDARRHSPLSSLDASLAQELAYGVSRQRRWLEIVLARYLDRPLPKQAVHVHEALLIGIYQAIFLDRVPAHTIVDEGVRLVGEARTEASYRGLVNAILRRVVAEDRAALLPAETDSWMLRHSVPEWLASEAGQIYRGGELVEFFAASNQSAPLNLRVVARADAPEASVLAERLRGEIVDVTHQTPDVEPGRFAPDCITVRGRGVSPDFLPSFRRGLVTAEDEAAQIVGWLCGAQPGMAILDLCASPGGKTSHLADLAERRPARLLATDVNEQKLARMRETLARLGLEKIVETALAGTVTEETHRNAFDLVLVDAPCSALGILRRHPEVRWRRTTRDLRFLARTQSELLSKAAPLVKPAGHLMYSVCTFTRAETDQVVRGFLEANKDFRMAAAPKGLPFDEKEFRVGEGTWRTSPHKHGCDAFFVARFERDAVS
ncbi:16S rRNA (cytosine(967)-C(5))-methyltransferase RsmB [soil metagenome]